MTPSYSRAAFSLIKLIIVIAIINLIGWAILSLFLDTSEDTQHTVIRADLENAMLNARMAYGARNNTYEGLCEDPTMKPFENKYLRANNSQSNWACTSIQNTWAFAIIAEETWVGGDDATKARIYCVDSTHENVGVYENKSKLQEDKQILDPETSKSDLDSALFDNAFANEAFVDTTACKFDYTE